MNYLILIILFCSFFIEIGNAQKGEIYYNFQKAKENPAEVYGLHIAVDQLDGEEHLFLDSLWYFPNLEQLIISNYNNSDKYIGFPMFILKLFNLKQLCFKSYTLKDIPKEIKNLKKIECLEFINTRLDRFPINIIQLKKLKTLTIENSNLNKIPKLLSKVAQLEHLDLSLNALDTLPLAIHKLKQLKKLKLTNCNIKTIRSGFGKFPRLIELDLEGNNLHDLPSTFSQLSALERLNLRKNVFEEFPEVVTSLVKLKEINLSYNQLQHFPNTFHNLKALTYLNLSYNQLQQFPLEILALSNLKHLELLKNTIKKLPERIEELKSMEHLNLCLNDLRFLPKSIVNLQNLRVLDCSFCYLEEIPKDLFALKHLEYLNFKYNELKRNPSILWNHTYTFKLNLVGNEYWTDRKEKKDRVDNSVKKFIDKRDGKVYETVQINAQTWMTEDLRFETATSIVDSLKTDVAWVRKYSVEEISKVCPESWHSATTKDWKILFEEVEKEFPIDPQAYYNLTTKKERVIVIDNREDPFVTFDPSAASRKYYNVTTYLSENYRTPKKHMNFYNLNIDLGFKRLGLVIKGYYAYGKDKKHRLYVFMSNSKAVQESIVDKEKISKWQYPVRCVKDE